MPTAFAGAEIELELDELIDLDTSPFDHPNCLASHSVRHLFQSALGGVIFG